MTQPTRSLRVTALFIVYGWTLLPAFLFAVNLMFAVPHAAATRAGAAPASAHHLAQGAAPRASGLAAHKDAEAAPTR